MLNSSVGPVRKQRMSKLRYLREWRRLPARVALLLRAWRNTSQGPRTIQIEHTKRCNLKCVMCQHGTTSPPEKQPDMTLDEFKTCLRDATALGNLTTVHIQGLGEPFLHKGFIEMVRYAKSLGLKTHAITNLTVMNDRIAEELIQSGHDFLAVSLDSPDREYFASIRRGVTFDVLDRVIENLRLLTRKQSELGIQTPEIAIYAIAMKSTLPQIPQMVALLKELGIRTLCFQELSTAGIDPDKVLPNGSRFVDESLNSLPAAELEKVIAQLSNLSDDRLTVVPSHIFDGFAVNGHHQDGIYTCLDIWERPAVAVDGTVTPCCYTVGSKLLNMGNIRHKSFQEIWHGPEFNALRRAHLLGTLPAVCQGCPQLYQFLIPWQILGRGHQDHPHRYRPIFLSRKRRISETTF